MPTQTARYTALGHAYFATTSSTAKSLASVATSGTNSAAMRNQSVKVYVTSDAALRFYMDGTTPTSTEGMPLAANTLLIIDTDPSKFNFITTGALGTVFAEFIGA